MGDEEEAVAQRGEYEKAAGLRSSRLRLQEEYDRERSDSLKDSDIDMRVDAKDIGHLIATWTGIPVDRLLEGEAEKLLYMEERLHERVVGQETAIKAVSDAVRRSRAGLSDPDRPLGVSFFWVPREWARRSLLALWPSTSSTTSKTWYASTCLSTGRSTPSPG